MKRMLVCAVLLAGMAVGAAAQEIGVYVAPGALGAGQAERMTALLEEAFPQTEWTLETDADGGLRQLVMEDRAPGLAICAPGEAMPWAREGLLLPLDGRIAEARRIQREALEAGVWEEKLYTAPLIARHRQVAVNADRLEAGQMASLLDRIACPVWQPSQLDQVLEEGFLAGETPMELWPPAPGESAAIEALVQALYGGRWMTEEGEINLTDPLVLAGLRWLGEMMECGVIGLAESREEALEHFLGGKTTMFIDWTDEEERLRRGMEDGAAFAVYTMPYPSADGLPMRSFDLTGVCAFDAGDAAVNALLLRAVSFLNEDEAAQTLLGSRRIYRDGAVWLPPLDADDRGATLRGLMGGALRDVMEREAHETGAVLRVQAALRAAGYR